MQQYEKCKSILTDSRKLASFCPGVVLPPHVTPWLWTCNKGILSTIECQFLQKNFLEPRFPAPNYQFTSTSSHLIPQINQEKIPSTLLGSTALGPNLPDKVTMVPCIISNHAPFLVLNLYFTRDVSSERHNQQI